MGVYNILQDSAHAILGVYNLPFTASQSGFVEIFTLLSQSGQLFRTFFSYSFIHAQNQIQSPEVEDWVERKGI